MKNNASLFNSALSAGANPNCWDNKGNVPLMLATKYGNIPFLEDLIDAGATLFVKNNEGQTAMAVALKYDQTIAAKHLKAAIEKQEETLKALVATLHLSELKTYIKEKSIPDDITGYSGDYSEYSILNKVLYYATTNRRQLNDWRKPSTSERVVNEAELLDLVKFLVTGGPMAALKAGGDYNWKPECMAHLGAFSKVAGYIAPNSKPSDCYSGFDDDKFPLRY